MSNGWVEACAVDDIDEEDVLRFDHGGRSFAIYRQPAKANFSRPTAFARMSSTHLADGLVMDDIIECPKHNGRFNYRTGAAKGAPVCVNLQTFAVKVVDGKVMIDIG